MPAGLAEDLESMWRLRCFEECARDMRLAGDIVGSIHLGIGQEAIPVAVTSLLEPNDRVFATYRGHNWALACGAPPEELFAELLGRAMGVNGGRGGSAYLSAPEYGFLGENSIVGAGAPIAVGAALAGRFDGSQRVSVSVFGDGAMNQGAVHEAMNFAAAMRLPVIFVCENNLWSEMTPISETVADDRLYRRAAAYGMSGTRVDGNDPDAVRDVVGGAIALARDGGGPTLVEAMAVRLVGHYVGDVEHYRPKSDVAAANAVEPIAAARRRLESEGTSADALNEIEKRSRAEIARAAEVALAAPLADPAGALTHVYA